MSIIYKMSRNLMLARHIFKKSRMNRSVAYCDCSPETDTRGNVLANKCTCGENDSNVFDWTWNDENLIPELRIDGNEVHFHPVYSQGTSAVRGNKVLDKQMIHYWEIKIVSCMNGTDLMVGIGTDKVDLMSHQYKYSSLLGLDDQSWGYSYRGLIQHNARLKYYGKRFSSSCIVGVYLDLRRRLIEFYLNRRPQGIAYQRMKIDQDAEIYPMACSTSSKSVVRLINATSFTETLQFLCMKVISKDQKSVEFVKSTPGLRHLCKDYWFLQSKEQFQYSESEFVNNNLLLEDEALLSCLRDRDSDHNMDTDTHSSTESFTDDMDIYNGVFDIKHHKRSTSSCSTEDEEVDIEFFCDHF